MSLFLCLYGISFKQYCRKSLAKKGGSGEKIKRGDGHIEGVSSNLLHTMYNYVLKFVIIIIIMLELDTE